MRPYHCCLLAMVVLVGASCAGNRAIGPARVSADYENLAPSVNALMEDWRGSSGEELVIDLESRVLRLGESGRSSVQLPGGYEWSVHHMTPSGHTELPAVTRLRLRATDGQKNACQEIIHIHGTISKEDGMYFDIKPGGYADSGTGVALLDSYACRPRVGKRYTVNESILVED